MLLRRAERSKSGCTNEKGASKEFAGADLTVAGVALVADILGFEMDTLSQLELCTAMGFGKKLEGRNKAGREVAHPTRPRVPNRHEIPY